MTDVVMVLFIGVLGVIMAASLQRRSGIYEFPFLAAVVFAGFILVQGFGLRHDDGLPEGSLARVFLMSILCAAACYAGFALAPSRLPVLNWVYDRKRLTQVAWALVGTGAIFEVMISRLPKEMTGASQWSGTPVAYNFFAQNFTYGLAIALLIYFRTKSKWAVAPICIGVFLDLDLAIVGVRRSAGAELLLMIMLTGWFVRRWCVPKLAFFGVVLLGTVALYSTGDIRHVIIGEKGYNSLLKGDFLPSGGDFKQIAFVDNLNDVLKNGSSGGVAEVRNAAHLMEGVSEEAAYDFGRVDWNFIVFNFVPAQLFGAGFKNAFYFKVDSPIVRGGSNGYEMTNGSTVTGPCDAFGSFGYLGFVKFVAISWVLGALYRSGLRGNVSGAIFYTVLIVSGLEAITHETTLFFARIIYSCVFAVPALRYAKSHDLSVPCPVALRSRDFTLRETDLAPVVNRAEAPSRVFRGRSQLLLSRRRRAVHVRARYRRHRRVGR